MNRLLVLVLISVLALGANANAKFTTVILDAGHGGHDRGGIQYQRVSEKAMALDVALRVRAILREQGVRTLMTRSSDCFVSLPKRVATANAQRRAVFVSIHFNASPRSGATGFETYYCHGDSAFLAGRIHGRLARLGMGENRGIKRRAYYVLRKTCVPAVLCEPGFLTNPCYSSSILRPAQRQRLAAAIASGILSAL